MTKLLLRVRLQLKGKLRDIVGGSDVSCIRNVEVERIVVV